MSNRDLGSAAGGCYRLTCLGMAVLLGCGASTLDEQNGDSAPGAGVSRGDGDSSPLEGDGVEPGGALPRDGQGRGVLATPDPDRPPPDTEDMTDPGDTRPGDIDPDPDPDPDPSIGPCDGQEPGDPIAVESAWIEGRGLVLELSHAGGCAEHDYGICWSEGALQSEPTTAELQVTHDARGDSCEAIVLQEQRFDLGPLLEQHRLEKGNEESEILLVLPGGLLLILPTSGEPPGDAGDVLDPVQALENAAEDMNHCALVDECVGLAWLDCQTRYVNVDEDVEGLQARVNAYIRDNSLGTLCPASCACGVLRCEAGRCETGPGDCGSPPEGETRICL